MGLTELVLELLELKPSLKVILAGNIVAMEACCVKRMIATC